MNTEDRILFMNDVAANLTGLDQPAERDTPLAQVYRLIDGTTGEAIEVATSSAPEANLTAKTPRGGDSDVSGDGAKTPIEDNAAPILDDAGNVVGKVIVFRDITRRKEAEAAHRANEEQLRSLANSISHLAWMAGPEGNTFWFNERWYQYTGTTPEQMQNEGWQRLHDPALLPEVVRRWKESVDTGITFDMEFPLRGANGQFRWFLTRVTPVTDSRGNVVRWFGTNTDIHEAREIREQLQRANASLAQFAYSASHDLREPLRNVTIYSQLLGMRYSQVLDEQGTEFLGYITEGATRMESLVTDLLTYAESGKPLEEAVEPVDAEAVLKDVLAGLRTVIEESGAKMIVGAIADAHDARRASAPVVPESYLQCN